MSLGHVRITGLDVPSRSDRELAALRAAQIGFVFPQFFLSEHQSVLDDVADGLLYAGVGPPERRARGLDAFALVGLDARPNAYLAAHVGITTATATVRGYTTAMAWGDDILLVIAIPAIILVNANAPSPRR